MTAPEHGGDRVTATLFGESASRAMVSVTADHLAAVLAAARSAGVPAARVGRTGGTAIRVSVDGAVAIDVERAVAEARWANALASWFDGRAA